jgi:hypothetical protein
MESESSSGKDAHEEEKLDGSPGMESSGCRYSLEELTQLAVVAFDNLSLHAQNEEEVEMPQHMHLQ